MMLFHAAMISRAAGDTDDARRYFERLLVINPRFNPGQASVARAVLDSVKHAVRTS